MIDATLLKAFEDPGGRIHVAYSAAQLVDADRDAGGRLVIDDFAELSRDVVLVSTGGKRMCIGEELDRFARRLAGEEDALEAHLGDDLWVIDREGRCCMIHDAAYADLHANLGALAEELRVAASEAPPSGAVRMRVIAMTLGGRAKALSHAQDAHDGRAIAETLANIDDTCHTVSDVDGAAQRLDHIFELTETLRRRLGRTGALT